MHLWTALCQAVVIREQPVIAEQGSCKAETDEDLLHGFAPPGTVCGGGLEGNAEHDTWGVFKRSPCASEGPQEEQKALDEGTALCFDNGHPGECTKMDEGLVCGTDKELTTYLKDRMRRGPTLLTGAAKGADQAFVDEALKLGHTAVNLYGKLNWLKGNVDLEVGTAVRISNAMLKQVEPALEKSAKRRGWEEWEDKPNPFSLRNYFQVADARTIYAVAYRNPWLVKRNNEKDTNVWRNEAGDEYERAMDIGGGTGRSLQLVVDLFEDSDPAQRPTIYFFDDAPLISSEKWMPKEVPAHFRRRGPATWGGALSPHYPDIAKTHTWKKWSTWNWDTRDWDPMEGLPPKPAGLYSGIGASKLDTGKKAIEELYAQKDQ